MKLLNFTEEEYLQMAKDEGDHEIAAGMAALPCSAYLEVSKDDLRVITEAVLSNIGDWQNSGPWQSERLHCRFCDRVLGDDLHKGHDLDCPVLVAISIRPNTASSQSAAGE